MRSTFKPSPAVPAATILAAIEVGNSLVRVRARTSGKAEETLSALLPDNIKPIEGSFVTIKTQTASFVEGFLKVVTPSIYVGDKESLSSVVSERGLTQTAANLYMDESETVWHLQSTSNVDGSGTLMLIKDSGDDIDELVASVKAKKVAETASEAPFVALIDNTDVGMVAYAGEDGNVHTGFVVAGVKGDSNRTTVVDPANGNTEPTVISTMQVLAFDNEFDPGEMDPLEYYIKLYNNDPRVRELLEDMLEWQD